MTTLSHNEGSRHTFNDTFEQMIFQRDAQARHKPFERSRRERALAKKLERAHEEILQAVHWRNFDPTNDVWMHYADTIDIEAYKFVSNSPVKFTDRLTRREFARKSEEVLSQCPNSRFHCESQSTTVDLKRERATIMAYILYGHNSEGFVVEAPAALHFRVNDGRWQIYKYQSFPGHDPLGLDRM